MLDIIIPMSVADSRFILPGRPEDCQAEPEAVAWREEFPADCDRRRQDGSVLCFEDEAPKWSFARIDGKGLITRIREKEVISTHATVGMYYLARRRDFVAAAIDMIAQNERVNNEFYVAPAYNHAIANGGRFGIFSFDKRRMHGTGTPADLDAYIPFRQGGTA